MSRSRNTQGCIVSSSEVYDLAFADHRYSVHTMQEPRYCWAMSELKKIRPLSIVEVGPGRGVLLGAMIQEFRLAEIRVIDVGLYHQELVSTVIGDLGHDDFPEINAEAVVCLDVLEHVESSRLPKAIEQLAMIAPTGIISVANHSDVHHGIELHLTQMAAPWWAEALSACYRHVLPRGTAHEGRAMFFLCEC